MKKFILPIVIALLIGLAAGYALFHRTQVAVGAVSSSGVTNTTTSWSSLVFNPLTSSSTSILNSGASDRAVLGSYIFCSSLGTSYTYTTGTALASLTLQAATTSTSATGLQGNTNYVLNTTVATATTAYYVASTTETTPNYFGRIWPVNTYLTYNFNATNTASCAIGAEWMPL